MDWEEFLLYTILPIIVSITSGVLGGYYLGKLAWLRTRKMENAKERLTSILIPMRDLANDTRKRIKNFQKRPFDYGESYYESETKLEEFSKVPIFNQIRIQYPGLYKDIMGFFRNARRLSLFSRQARRDIMKGIETTLDFLIPQETIEVDPVYVEHKDPAQAKKDVLWNLVRIMHPAILTSWSNNRIVRESGKELHEILTRFSPLEIDMMDFVNHLRGILGEVKSIEMYRATVQKILNSQETLIDTLTKRIEEDANLAYPESLLSKRKSRS